MAPNQRVVVASSGRPQKGFLGAAYEELTAPENATIVRSLLVFGAGVAFLHSSLSEFLLPPAALDAILGQKLIETVCEQTPMKPGRPRLEISGISPGVIDNPLDHDTDEAAFLLSYFVPALI
ncbi:hypothetical protein CNMCM5793_004234 [Aspergillus hiratsukae]|uniref:Uncharacterized protein n=1 Tax=Aspergillus hiratsukae TaxID=1194566 RepID=A0A8H6UHP4_9EURO|nr:hypothetical protein CNMCM5793_004234 [Aspergillus hiratsukae]KAF7169592.1 hypothetical protein CNMCM6106_004469 [Aspergillus hiratsukae]